MTSRAGGSIKTILTAAAAAALVAMLGASMTDLGPWYQALKKPAWQPPDWLFGPAWTLIFSLAATSGVLAWGRAADGVRSSREVGALRQQIVGLFALNGLLNVGWSALFFTVKRPDWALWEVVALWLSIVALIVVTGRASRAAALLLVPYLVWVTFAGVLNLAVVQLNP